MYKSRRLVWCNVSSVLMLLGLLSIEIAAESDASRIFIEKTGAGNSVFVIPGLSSSTDIFKNTFTESTIEGSVNWVTLAGFGGTAPPEDLDSFTQPVVDELVLYLEDNDLQNVALIGHSMGGLISLLVASQQNQRVDRILVIDAVPFLAGLMSPGADPAETLKGKDAMRAHFSSMSPDQYTATMKQGLPIQATSASSQALVMADIARSDQQAVAAALAEIFTIDYRSVLSEIDAAVTVLVPHNQYSPGTADQLLARYQALYEGLDNVEFKIISDSRHFVMLDQPEVFVREVDLFLGKDTSE